MSLTKTVRMRSVTYEQPLGLYINEKWTPGLEGKTFETVNSAIEETIVEVHEAGAEGKELRVTPCTPPCKTRPHIFT